MVFAAAKEGMEREAKRLHLEKEVKQKVQQEADNWQLWSCQCLFIFIKWSQQHCWSKGADWILF
eukprot:13346448-Ditylum_brightwellii.AAC.1